jgi:hypothetical protein
MRTLSVTLLTLSIWLTWSPGLSAQEPAACSAAGDVQFVCGQQAPEDLVVVPGADWVGASAYSGSGGLYVIRVSDRTSMRAYPAPGASQRLDAQTYPTCPGPPDTTENRFQTHGLYMQAGPASVHRLYVVGHGGRESVEVFEVDVRGSTPALTWIGCAVAPDPIGLNSVRALADGGFVASNFLPRGAPGGFQAVNKGELNGELWEWHTGPGWSKVPGGEASGANGLEISDDGRWIYVAAWGTQSFFRLSHGRTPVERNEVPLGFRVDNIRWARDGSILAAGQGGGPGGQYTSVVKIDPDTLAVREIIRHPNAEAFGAGTVAVEVGDTIWVGSFRGDRLAVFPAP